jgi:hypothetical protein
MMKSWDVSNKEAEVEEAKGERGPLRVLASNHRVPTTEEMDKGK